MATPHRFTTHTRAFSLIELLACLGILSLLTAFLLPVIGTQTAMARRAADQSGLRQLASAWTMYCQDHDDQAMPSPRHPDKPREAKADGTPPSSDHAFPGLAPYLGNRVPTDPVATGHQADEHWGVVHHAYNVAYIGGTRNLDPSHFRAMSWKTEPAHLAHIEVPWDTLLFCDSGRYVQPGRPLMCVPFAWPPSGLPHHPPTIHARHGGRANVAFADGHACSVVVRLPQGHPFERRWRVAELGWLLRGQTVDDSLYDGRGAR